MPTTVELLYGRGTVPLTLSDAWDATVVRKRSMPLVEDPSKATQSAFEDPVQSRRLVDEARDADTACILICDITRPVPNGVILPPLIRTLLAAGIDRSRITVLIATGLHRPVEDAELNELVGDPWVLETVRIENHFARDDEAHVDLGCTCRGTRALVDRRFVEADLKIATGLVEPHLMAGFSGGRKVIVPGVAHRETITTLHNASFLEHPRVDYCVLDGNPLHEEQLAIVKRLGGALAINTVIDEERRLSFVNFGEVEASHLQAVEFVRRYAEIPVSRKFHTIVTTAAGHPLDNTYYQTIKGIVSPIAILEPGGTVIIASRCAEGLGSADFFEAQRRYIELGPEAFISDVLEKPHAAIDAWQTEMQVRTQRVGSIQLLTEGLDAREQSLTGVEVIDDLDRAVARSVERSGDPALAVIPEGPYVVPFHQPDRAQGRPGNSP